MDQKIYTLTLKTVEVVTGMVYIWNRFSTLICDSGAQTHIDYFTPSVLVIG